MKLSGRAEAMLRVLVLLVNRETTGATTPGELATGMRISEESLAGLLHPLVERGFIEEEAGKGYRLWKDPNDITLGDLVLLAGVNEKRTESPKAENEATANNSDEDHSKGLETIRRKLKKLGYL